MILLYLENSISKVRLSKDDGGQSVIELPGDLETGWREAAEEAIENCALGIVDVDVLVERMQQEWGRREEQDAQPTCEVLKRIALRLCSLALCMAWQSADPLEHECAAANMRRYLYASLQRSSYVDALRYREDMLEDILHETLECLQEGYIKELQAVPRDPAAFLKWAQTILLRQAYAFVVKVRRDTHLSLEDDFEDVVVAYRLGDAQPVYEYLPEEYVEWGELRQALSNAILSLRNRNYRNVILYMYHIGMDEQELSEILGVTRQTIYLWKCRAFQELRKKPELVRFLRE